MTTNGHSPNGWRTGPLYTVSEAAHLAHVSPNTVRNWLYGSERQESLFRTPQTPMVSFLQLVEILVAANFRKAVRVSLQRVRRAYTNAQEMFQLENPFAHLRLEVIGGHIVHAIHDPLALPTYQSMDEPAQWTLPGLVLNVINQIRYESDLAARWYPVGDDIPIVVDPRITSGVPTIEGRRVTVRIIRKRFLAGQEIDFIAQDYELEKFRDLISFGGSPRASINLALAAKAYAFIKRRGYVIPEDVRAICTDVMRHRIGLTYEAEAENITSEEIIAEILNTVEVP